MSSEVLAELKKLHMDEIGLNGNNLSDMQSLKDKTANKDESKMVISERDLADMIILYETKAGVGAALDAGKMLSDFVSSGRKDLSVTVTFYEAPDGENVATMGVKFSDYDQIFDMYVGKSMYVREDYLAKDKKCNADMVSRDAFRIYQDVLGGELSGNMEINETIEFYNNYDIVINMDERHKYEEFHVMLSFDDTGCMRTYTNIYAGDKMQIIQKGGIVGDDKVLCEVPLIEFEYGTVDSKAKEKILEGLEKGLQ